MTNLFFRGGVEDTRLEAKAKDTKKNPRPRPWPRTAFPRTDTLEAKDRNARGQGQGPRTQAKCSPKKKRSSQKFFRRSPKLAEDWPIFEDLRPQGQGQGQGLQNVSSRTPPLDMRFVSKFVFCRCNSSPV